MLERIEFFFSNHNSMRIAMHVVKRRYLQKSLARRAGFANLATAERLTLRPSVVPTGTVRDGLSIR
jgi:hypothetical protein